MVSVWKELRGSEGVKQPIQSWKNLLTLPRRNMGRRGHIFTLFSLRGRWKNCPSSDDFLLTHTYTQILRIFPDYGKKNVSTNDSYHSALLANQSTTLALALIELHTKCVLGKEYFFAMQVLRCSCNRRECSKRMFWRCRRKNERRVIIALRN